jgi:hypothetical protein
LETRGIWLIFGFVKTLKENFNNGCFIPSEGTTQLLLNPHFRNKMQQFIYEMKLIIIMLNVTNGTFIYSSGQPFKKLAPFSQSNRVVSFCKVSLMFDRNTFRWGISRGHCAMCSMKLTCWSFVVILEVKWRE